MHRYRADTLAKIRIDYIHEQQSKYRTLIADLKERMDEETGSQKVRRDKMHKKISEQAEELRLYEEKIRHIADQMIEIDLDDGVNFNYDKFKELLAKK